MSYAGNYPDSAAPTGFCPAPPPPPPPPPGAGQVPALRINTAEAPRAIRRPQNNNDPYEPPAAIQNAMMTKDKKPFTYTPGMGGKLDLSQIRSPRMARRVAKNANDEGIEGPPKSALEPKPASSSNAGNIYVQPQVAVPVFPANLPVQQPINRTPSAHVNRVPSNASNSQPEPPRSVGRNEGKVTPITIVPSIPSSPQSPTSPPQVTLAKAPTPWLQNKPKQQEELPEWAKRANSNKMAEVHSPENSSQVSTIYHQPQQQSQVQSYVQSPSPQPQIVQRQTPVQQVVASQPRQQERVVPLRVEDRPSVFSVKNEPGHHQFKQSPNQQQRWGQPQPQPQIQQSGGARIIPIMVEDNGQSQARTLPVDIQGPRVVVNRGTAPGPAANQGEPGPLQSRSFRVLQKITDTDPDTDVDGNSEQIRKLQLTEDDKVLMNKFKEQVDGETYLHQEEDPRYRGAAIPSRAFRFLQNMTDSGEVPSTSNAPRPPSAINKKQNRNSKSFEEAQANLPPSEQQVQEPKKYMGSAIPSRSFRILQAMTSPENIAPQENHQQDFTSRTENSVTGNQQSGVFFPNCSPSPYWNPENAWWGYYPVQYAPQNSPNNIPQPLNVAYNPYAYCGYGDGNSFAYYPMYDQNYSQNYSHNYANQNENRGEGGGEGEGRGNFETIGQSQPEMGTTYPPGIHGYIPMQIYSGDENYQQQLQNYNQFNSNGIQQTQLPPSNDNEADKTKKKNNVVKNTATTNEDQKSTDRTSKFLTVPKWSKQINSSTNIEKNGNDTNNYQINIRSDNSTGIQTAKDSSGGTINSKTDTDHTPETDTDSDSSDSESDSSESSDDSSSSSSDDSSESSSSSSDGNSNAEYHAYTNEAVAPVAVIVAQVPPVKSNSEKEFSLQSLSATTISEEGYEHSSKISSEKLSCSDCDSDADDEYQIESLNNDCILPHQLSVIYEDPEQTETESESKKLDNLKENYETFSESGGDPPDDSDSTTVSVSLPLRFKFSVSENNEDVTTVIVGDSTVKSGKKYESQERISRSCTEPNDSNEVHVNFKIKANNNTSVDFTLKKNRTSSPSDESSFDTEFTLTKDQTEINLRENVAESLDAKVTLRDSATDENANLKIGGEENPSEWRENVETEFTVRRKTTDVTRHVWKKDLDLETERELETFVKNDESREDTETEFTVRNNETNSATENGYDAEYEITTATAEVRENLHKEIVEQKSLKIKERESVQTEFDVKKIKKVGNEAEIENRDDCEKRVETVEVKVEIKEEEEEEKDEPFDYTTVQNFNGAKRLLSVQNSRDETDDEDSGVTSDMSRMISEVDTDSECASIRRMNKYQRTQTHSRLFKLLNDDAILAEEDSSEDNCYSPSGARREHLSLPLKPNVFNYDETNYYSNYSSGITSPDYSPLCEQSWRRIHEGRCALESENSSSVTTPNEICVDLLNETINNNFGTFIQQGNDSKPAPHDDPYFQTWKKVVSPVEFDYDILPSIAFKKLKKLENSGIAGNFIGGKTNRINILCPRIKSSKNVPKTLQELSSPRKATAAAAAASSIPFLSTKSSLKNGHC